jgi:TPR repeat protein
MAPLSWDTASQAYIRGDYETALRQWRPLAENGHDNPQHGLGEMYAEGKGVPQDYVLAHMWFNLSAAQGNELAKHDRKKIERRMTPSQIAEAQRLARDWFEKHQLRKQRMDEIAKQLEDGNAALETDDPKQAP